MRSSDREKGSRVESAKSKSAPCRFQPSGLCRPHSPGSTPAHRISSATLRPRSRVRFGPWTSEGRRADVPSEANFRRRTKPIPGAERSQFPAPSEAKIRLPFTSVRLRAARGREGEAPAPTEANPPRRARPIPQRRANPIHRRRANPIPLRQAGPGVPDIGPRLPDCQRAHWNHRNSTPLRSPIPRRGAASTTMAGRRVDQTGDPRDN